MTEFPHLADFKSKEGYWHKKDIFRPLIEYIFFDIRPDYMLEIGFNIGYSASMWLEFDPAKRIVVTSVDIGNHKDTIKAAEAVKKLHKNRFNFILSDSKLVKPQLKGKRFDLAFIDGDHSASGVAADIRLCLDLKIPYLLFDDWHLPDKEGNEMNAIRSICEETFSNELTKLKVFDLEGIVPPSSKVAFYRNDTINP